MVPPYLVTNSPRVVEHVLKTEFTNYVKGEYFDSRLGDLLGHGIFNSDGDEWRVQRKIAANIFNVVNFREFVAVVFKEKMQDLYEFLSQNSGDFRNSNELNLHDLFYRFTLDGFCKIGFNHELNCLKSTKPPEFALAFDRMQATVDFRFINPLWRILQLPFQSRISRDLETVKSFCMQMVKTRHATSTTTTSSSDLLGLFIKSGKFSDEQLADFVLNFIVAGRDTTAQALSWTIFCLAKNPKQKQLLMSEIDQLGTESPSYEQVKSLKLAKAAFLEALRLYPSVPKNIKVALNDDVWPDGTIVPSGSAVVWSPYVMGRSPEIWGSDALEYRLSRWETLNPSQFDYPVFHAGPRICLGKTLAELEGVYVLVCLLQSFDIQVVNLDQVHYGTSLTMSMNPPIMVKIKKR